MGRGRGPGRLVRRRAAGALPGAFHSGDTGGDRNARLREKRLSLLKDLEATAAEQPRPTDALAGWLEPALAEEFLQRGVLTLGELQALIAPGGRWWQGLRAFGVTKAARLARQIEQLIGEAPAPVWALGAAGGARELSGQAGVNRAPHGAAAIAARSGSVLTAKACEREAERFILWIVLERGRALSDATVEDCRACMDFLSAVPTRWISRRQLPRLAAGWAPFSGPLSVASQARPSASCTRC